MKFLPLLLVGGGVYLFTKNKKPSRTSKSSEGESEIKNTDNDVGYKIVNCKLTVTNKEKALDNVFNISKSNFEKLTDIEKVMSNIFGFCLSDDNAHILISNQNDSDNVYELYKYALSGAVAGGFRKEWLQNQPELAMTDILLRLKFLITAISGLGFNTKNYAVELVKKD